MNSSYVTEALVASGAAEPAASVEIDYAAARSFVLESVTTTPGTGQRRGAGRGPAAERRRSQELLRDLPCRSHHPDLWFAEAPADLELAKALCGECPIRLACLAVAVRRAEVVGVWGGQIFDRGRIVPKKRPRGRPRKPRPAGPAEQRLLEPEHEMMTRNDVPPLEAGRSASHEAADHLYDAECALHTAHQSGVDTWIAAANEKLHEAVDGYLAAIHTRPDAIDDVITDARPGTRWTACARGRLRQR